MKQQRKPKKKIKIKIKIKTYPFRPKNNYAMLLISYFTLKNIYKKKSAQEQKKKTGSFWSSSNTGVITVISGKWLPKKIKKKKKSERNKEQNDEKNETSTQKKKSLLLLKISPQDFLFFKDFFSCAHTPKLGVHIIFLEPSFANLVSLFCSLLGRNIFSKKKKIKPKEHLENFFSALFLLVIEVTLVFGH